MLYNYEGYGVDTGETFHEPDKRHRIATRHTADELTELILASRRRLSSFVWPSWRHKIVCSTPGGRPWCHWNRNLHCLPASYGPQGRRTKNVQGTLHRLGHSYWPTGPDVWRSILRWRNSCQTIWWQTFGWTRKLMGPVAVMLCVVAETVPKDLAIQQREQGLT